MARQDFDDSGYSPEEIYQEGTQDEHGHSANFRCKVPTTWGSIIDEFVDSKDFPEIRKRNDFVRDAIYHRIRFWNAAAKERRMADPVVRELIAQEHIAGRLTSETNRRMRRIEFMDQMRETLQAAIVADKSLVLEMVDDFVVQANDFNEPYRGQLLDELETWRKRAEGW